jgi:hypothetical protein
MIVIRVPLATAAVCIAALLVIVPGHAQTPPASSPAAAPLQGFSAQGTLAVQAMVEGSAFNFAADVAVMNSKRRVRIDVLHLTMSGSDPNQNAVMAQFVPQGTVTLVYDQGSGTTTLWSEQKRVYYQTKMRAAPTPRATPTPKPTATASSPIDQLLRATKSITEYDVLTQTLTLVGHQPINGHTSSLFHFALQSQKHGGKLQDVSGDLALADDLSGIPIRFWVTAKGDHEGSLKLDLVSASATLPDASVFVVPAGYKKVGDILQVFGSAPGH